MNSLQCLNCASFFVFSSLMAACCACLMRFPGTSHQAQNTWLVGLCWNLYCFEDCLQHAKRGATMSPSWHRTSTSAVSAIANFSQSQEGGRWLKLKGHSLASQYFWLKDPQGEYSDRFFNPHVQCCVVFTCLSAIQHASCAPFTNTTCRNKLEQFHSWLDWLSQPRVYDTNIGKSWINMSSLRRASPFSTLACQASPMHRNRRGCVKRLQETSPNKFVSFLCNKIICS